MKARYLAVTLLIALAACCLAGCGAKSSAFTVDYVGKAGNALIIVGKYQGKTAKLAAGAFKDCTLVEASPLSGDTVDITGTAEGYLRIMGGVLLKLKGPDGKTVEVEVKEGGKFELDTSDKDAWKLLLP